MYIVNRNSLNDLFDSYNAQKNNTFNGVPHTEENCIVATPDVMWDLELKFNQKPDMIGKTLEYGDREVEIFKTKRGYVTWSNARAFASVCKVTPITDNKIKSNSPKKTSDCPCDCREVTSIKKVYLVKTKYTQNDQPVNIVSKVLECTSKNNSKKYEYPCNTNQEKINAINTMQGLNDCPCDCKEVTKNEIWYLTEDKNSGGIELELKVTEKICDTPTQKPQRSVPCSEITNALNKMGYPVTSTALNGLSDEIYLNALSNSGKEINDFDPNTFNPVKKDTNKASVVPDCENQNGGVWAFIGGLTALKIISII